MLVRNCILYMNNNSLGIQESECHFNMETFLEGDIGLYAMVYFLNSKHGLFFLYIHKKQKIQSNFTILSYTFIFIITNLVSY